SSRRRHTRFSRDWSSDVCSSDLRFCWTHGVHTWVVAHPKILQKKPDAAEYPVPTPYDVSGSAHWRNKADNCITVYRIMQEGPQRSEERRVGKERRAAAAASQEAR